MSSAEERNENSAVKCDAPGREENAPEVASSKKLATSAPAESSDSPRLRIGIPSPTADLFGQHGGRGWRSFGGRSNKFHQTLHKSLKPHSSDSPTSALESCWEELERERGAAVTRTLLDAPDDRGKTPLLLACTIADEKEACSAVAFLLRHGASVHAVDENGYTPLHWGSVCSGPRLVELLVDTHGAVVDAECDQGETPAHRASRFGKQETLAALLERGASVTHRNVERETVLDVAGFTARDQLPLPLRPAIRALLLDHRPELAVAVLSHDDCAGHTPMGTHQEAPERVSCILEKLRNQRKFSGREIRFVDVPSVATDEQIHRAHSEQYLSLVKSLHAMLANESADAVPFTPMLQRGLRRTELFKPATHSDTYFSCGSLQAARRAAGSVCEAIDMVVQGKAQNAFCCVRPPGHHAGINGLLAESDTFSSCGFCIFNNVAIGALHALATHRSIRRVAVLDFDNHHGNGTEEIIRAWSAANPDSKSLYFCSMHLFDVETVPRRTDSVPPDMGHSMREDEPVERPVSSPPDSGAVGHLRHPTAMGSGFDRRWGPHHTLTPLAARPSWRPSQEPETRSSPASVLRQQNGARKRSLSDAGGISPGLAMPGGGGETAGSAAGTAEAEAGAADGVKEEAPPAKRQRLLPSDGTLQRAFSDISPSLPPLEKRENAQRDSSDAVLPAGDQFQFVQASSELGPPCSLVSSPLMQTEPKLQTRQLLVSLQRHGGGRSGGGSGRFASSHSIHSLPASSPLVRAASMAGVDKEAHDAALAVSAQLQWRSRGGPVPTIRTGDTWKDGHVESTFYPGSGYEDCVPANVFNCPMKPLWAARREGANGSPLTVTASGARPTASSARSSPSCSSSQASASPPSLPSTQPKQSRSSPKKQQSPARAPKSATEAPSQQLCHAVRSRLVPTLQSFGPDLILISAGFDGATGDVGNCHNGSVVARGSDLKPQDYAWLTNEVLAVARRHCPGRVVSVLEGGYGTWRHDSSDRVDRPATRSSLRRRSKRGRAGKRHDHTESDAGHTNGDNDNDDDDDEQDANGKESQTDGTKWVMDRSGLAAAAAAHVRALVDNGMDVGPVQRPAVPQARRG